MKRAIWLWLALLLAVASPASSQVVGYPTVTSVGGSANAITGTIATALAIGDLQGSLIYLVPSSNNTGTTTLNINGFGAVALRKTSGSGLTPLTGVPELVSGQPVALYYDGTYFDIVSAISTSVGANGLANSALAFTVPTNLQLNGSIPSNKLTLAFCTTNSGSNTCNNPSSTNPILFSFPDSASAAYGDPNIVSQQAAASVAASATTDSMGCPTGVPCHVWVWAANNGGTVVPCLYVPLSGTSIIDLDETAAQSSGGSPGASAQTLYCSSAVSGVAVRRVGLIEATWTSGSGWTNIGKVRLFGPSVPMPGNVVQDIYGSSTTQSSGSGTGFNTTVPAASITPTTAANLVKAIGVGTLEQSTTGYAEAAMFRASGASAACTTQIGATANANLGNGAVVPAAVGGTDTPQTATQQTYNVCIKNTTSPSNLNWCPTEGVTNTCTIEVIEIMTMREPANDDDPALARMVG